MKIKTKRKGKRIKTKIKKNQKKHQKKIKKMKKKMNLNLIISIFQQNFKTKTYQKIGLNSMIPQLLQFQSTESKSSLEGPMEMLISQFIEKEPFQIKKFKFQFTCKKT